MEDPRSRQQASKWERGAPRGGERGASGGSRCGRRPRQRGIPTAFSRRGADQGVTGGRQGSSSRSPWRRRSKHPRAPSVASD
ncbi:hypothetical protein GQ55_1G250800 [Panicum hallii var. hallii]|uniref:Uncharacterized protein n=1 Tax=Panicum hallii var. hallii TaxID=1504633 RepID=A0A2T7F798_9POAL|nr:hypothetical protein GQ55_1G250800 [Panicum hallii var. hallii]